MSMKNSSDTIGNRTRDLPPCSAVSQPTVPPRVPTKKEKEYQYYCHKATYINLHKYRKLNNTIRMPLQLTRFIDSVIFTYPFPILRNLSPHSINTNLHIFLSLSYSFLLLVGSWLPCPYTYLPHAAESFLRS